MTVGYERAWDSVYNTYCNCPRLFDQQECVDEHSNQHSNWLLMIQENPSLSNVPSCARYIIPVKFLNILIELEAKLRIFFFCVFLQSHYLLHYYNYYYYDPHRDHDDFSSSSSSSFSSSSVCVCASSFLYALGEFVPLNSEVLLLELYQHHYCLLRY